MIKIILDTNVLISWLITDKIQILDKLIFGKKVMLITCEELIHEFLAVSMRERFRRYFSEEKTKELLMLLEPSLHFVSITSIIEECRDPEDNFLLALAKDAEADYLVTGDKDLLDIKTFHGTRIIAPTDLEAIGL